MKYSINSIGFIVAERDIYSLGGFIPKGSVGTKVANEDQISQDGDCWVSGGDISGRPDVRVKDNAYIGNFVGATGMHTDGVTEFSGDTLIPGKIIVRNPIADPVNNFFAKDSFIGISMDVLCGPSTTTTAFPFEQGDFKKEAAKGTLFASMGLEDVSACRSTSILRLGRNTYLYIPTGYRARVFWAYYDASYQLAYSGESTTVVAGLTKLDHPVYKLAVVVVVKNDGTAMTPAQLGTSGAKILGHISGSVNVDIRPESASGSYVMDNSSFIVKTSNFGLATTQLRFVAGGMFDSTMYTPDDRGDYKPYGTFHNVHRLEYTKYLSDAHRTNVNRDRYISAYDCPLLRVDNNTFDSSLAGKGDLVLRNCIVPKAEFQDDVINGNTYEGIDFSFTNEDLGYTMTGYARFISSHKRGIYRLSGGPSSAGFASHKGNLADTARLFQAEEYIPLDGSIMEQGLYGGGSPGTYYESAKSAGATRVRTGKPLPTFGLVFPSLPAGYSVKALYYLDEDFIIRSSVMDPTGVDTTYPYVVMVFRKDGDSAINVTDFIALNRTLRIIDHTKAPEITGSAYVGAGVTVRGDVQLHGDPYVNRVFDVNMWERGSCQPTRYLIGGDYESGKAAGTGEGIRFRSVDSLPVEPGDIISCAEGYFIYAYWYDGFGLYSSESSWSRTFTVTGNNRFLGIVLKKGTAASDAGGLITEEDLAIANVKYVRAFKKRRYITNELDRTSPEDILLSVDYFRRATVSTSAASAGVYYESLIYPSQVWLSLKRLLNAGASWALTVGDSTTYLSAASSWDALTKLIGAGIRDGVALVSLEVRKKDSSTIALADIESARLIIEFTPSPRIVVPYGVSNVWIEGTKVRMYDNSVISRTITKGAGVILKGDAVMGSVFTGDVCMCSNGHSDAIIKLP